MFDLGAAILKIRGDRAPLEQELDAAKGSATGWASNLGGALSGLVGGALGLAANTAVNVIGSAGAAAMGLSNDINASSRELQAQLGVTGEEGDRLAQMSKEIWADNWGNDMADVTAVMADVRQQLAGIGQVSDENTTKLTTGAIALRDTFGGETAEYVSAAKTLMDEFGLSADQAMDFVTSGMQGGLNASGDFLDSIGEYSNLFAENGTSAAGFFSTLETGLAGGALGTDKIADAFKESGIRIREMSDDTQSALGILGATTFGADLAAQFGASGDMLIDTEEKAQAVVDRLNSLGIEIDVNDIAKPMQVLNEETGKMEWQFASMGSTFRHSIAAAVGDGSMSVDQVQQLAIEGLRGVGNEVDRNNLGVQLFGTQWEDMGASAILGVDMAKTSMADLAGATDGLNVRYETWPAMWEGFKRQAVGALEPLSSGLLDLANSAMPAVQAGLSMLTDGLTSIVNAIILVATGDMSGGIFGLSEDSLPIAVLFALHDAIMFVVNAVTTALSGDATAGVAMFGGAFTNVQAIIDTALAYITSVLTTWGSVALAFWQQNGAQIQADTAAAWTTVQTIIQGVADFIIPLLQGVAAFFAAHGGEIAAILGGAYQVVSSLVMGALNIIAGLIQAAIALWNGDWSGFRDALLGIFSDTWNALEGIVSGALDIIRNVISTAFDGFVTIANSMGANISEGVASGIKNSAGAVADAILGAVGGAIDAAKKFLGIASPSKLAGREIGQWLPPGVAEGIKQTGKIIGDTFTKTVRGAVEVTAQATERMVAPLGDDITMALGTSLKRGGEAIAAPLAEGISVGVSKGGASIGTALAKASIDGLKATQRVLQIASPSRLAARMVGDWLPVGIADGIANTAGVAINALKGVGKDLLKELASIQEKAAGLMEDLYRGGLRGTADLARERSRALDDIAAFKADQEQRLVDLATNGVDISPDALNNVRFLQSVVQSQIETAASWAAEMAKTDPEAAAQYFAAQKQNILELAKLQEDYQLAQDQESKDRLLAQIDLLQQAIGAEDDLARRERGDRGNALTQLAQELVTALAGTGNPAAIGALSALSTTLNVGGISVNAPGLVTMTDLQKMINEAIAALERRLDQKKR